MVASRHDLSGEQALKILAVFKKMNMVRLDATGGRYVLGHRSYLDRYYVRRALIKYDAEPHTYLCSVPGISVSEQQSAIRTQL